MNENLTTIIITFLTVVTGAGAWKFYEFIVRNRREKEKEVLTEQTVYRDDLKKRVEILQKDKDAYQKTILDMSTQLAAINVKVEFLQKENERLNWTVKNGKGY
tara:strand:- start:537 stop:845 length:309 start_codon:yes stop_codon:yes gene_type:complete